MILDTIDNFSKYEALNPLFKAVAQYLKETDLAAQPAGKVELQGKDLFVNFSRAKGKTQAEARLESHDVMLDIQIPLSGPETMGYTPRRDLPAVPYDAANDISFYEGEAEQYVTVHPGEFAIFFPQDGHAPCISDAAIIQKVIVKVKN